MPRLGEASYRRNRQLQRKRNDASNKRRSRSHGILDSDIRRRNSRAFVGWDGEGHNTYAVAASGECTVQHHYMLFGSSTGQYVSDFDLSTQACLDLILYVEEQDPDCFHVGFAFEYDVNMILRDLEWRHLAILYDTGQVIWRGYRIKHIPHKIFSVSKNGVSATIFDVFGFFHTSYLRALSKHGIGTAEQIGIITAGKKHRSTFCYSELQEVKRYWSVEISLLPPLMEKLRESCYGAGFFITQWHGPGALASFALKKNGAFNWKGKKPPLAVQQARLFAYAGGRFQAWKCGYYLGPIYTADINSAYAYACSLLPRLDTGKWEFASRPNIQSPKDIAHFALYRIEFDASEMDSKARQNGIPFPLFHRDKEGRLTWPAKTEGWYWSPEAATVAGSKHAIFREAWIFHDDGQRPFGFVRGAYDRRLQLQAIGDAIEKAYKWFLCSIYGQFAQRVGWNRNTRSAPRSHQIEWAGYITSYCRAFAYRAAVDAARRGGLISIDTDGVTSSVPFDPARLPNGVGTGLGEWKLESFDGILYWQNGIYWLLNNDGEWEEPKSRGVPRGYLSIDRAMSVLSTGLHSEKGENPTIELYRSRFIGYRQAMQHQYDTWRHWLSEQVKIEFGGSGKGRHVAYLCGTCGERRRSGAASNSLHTVTHFPPNSPDSHPHTLPWLASKAEPEQNVEDLGIWEDKLVGSE